MCRAPNDDRSDAMRPNSPAGRAESRGNRTGQVSGGEPPKAAPAPPIDPKRLADLEDRVAEIEKLVGRPFGASFYSLSDRVKRLEDNSRRVDDLEGRVGRPFGASSYSLSDRVKRLEDDSRRVDDLEGRVGRPFGASSYSLSDRVKRLEDNSRPQGRY